MSFDKIGIGEGKLYEGDDFDTATALGYTRGASFDDQYDLRHIPVDGKPGNMVGDGVYNESNPFLDVTTMVMSSSNLEKLFFGIEVLADTPAVGDVTIKRKTSNPVESDYKTFWWVGKLKDGKVWRIKLENALGLGNLNESYNDKGEIEIPARIECHFLTEDDTHLPFQKILIGEATV